MIGSNSSDLLKGCAFTCNGMFWIYRMLRCRIRLRSTLVFFLWRILPMLSCKYYWKTTCCIFMQTPKELWYIRVYQNACHEKLPAPEYSQYPWKYCKTQSVYSKDKEFPSKIICQLRARKRISHDIFISFLLSFSSSPSWICPVIPLPSLHYDFSPEEHLKMHVDCYLKDIYLK